jgi:hypothetical protein
MGNSDFDWSTKLRIGHNFKGHIRDVKVFENTGATSDEVAELYAGDTPSTLADNLKVSLDFTGSDPYNDSASGNTVTQVNSPATEELKYLWWPRHHLRSLIGHSVLL